MASLEDLRLRVKGFKAELMTELPRKIAQDMYDETMRNFDAEAYTNDGDAERWADRPYEELLGYKKLDYTGRMKRSIKPMKKKIGSKSAIAGVKSSLAYAQSHNEGGVVIARQPRGSGNRTLTDGRKVNISKSRVRKRQFMGVGSKTVSQAKLRIHEVAKKWL